MLSGAKLNKAFSKLAFSIVQLFNHVGIFLNYFDTSIINLPPWRNRLARSAVNRKVGGSSPPGGADTFFLLSVAINVNKT